MFEPCHVLRPGLFCVLVTAVIVGPLTGAREARAESLSSALASFSERRLQQEQKASSPQVGAVPVNEQTEGDVPFSELNEALSAARARLAELTKAAEIAKVASELREELEAAKTEIGQLQATLNQIRSENAELQSTKQTAINQADEAEKALTEATAEARRLDEELVAMRWQNSQLTTSLARAETFQRDSAEELVTVKNELSSRIETLSASAEGSAAEVAKLREELDATRGSALIAEQRGAELDEQLAKRNVKASEAEAEATKLASDLGITIAELGGARTELATTQEALDEATITLAATNQEAAVLREQFAANRDEVDRLRNELETAQSQIGLVNASNVDLQKQVKILRTAAGEATDAARLNLIAVETQINEINAALATVKGDEITAPSGGPTIPAANSDIPGIDDQANGTLTSTEVAATGKDIWVPALTPARAAVVGQQQLIAANSPRPAASQKASNPPAASSPLANRVIKTDVEDVPPTTAVSFPTEVASLITALPNERRQRAENLLTDLNVRAAESGLTMTVPGTILFAVNSETIEPDAYDTLAKVAEMVDLYDDRDVLIVGHTDAVGDDGYNQELSERRADLVKDYFIKEFEIGTNRLSAEGQGEQRPLTSNATAEGRDINRRVEVIILN